MYISMYAYRLLSKKLTLVVRADMSTIGDFAKHKSQHPRKELGKF